MMDPVAHFLACFEQLRYVGSDDRFEAEGRGVLAKAVSSFVEAGEPIELLLPGFPHKNPNRAKTLGPEPDLGEELALGRLVEFCASVSAGYQPAGHASGCRITVFADGRVWGDLLGVSGEELRAYGQSLRSIEGLAPHLRFDSLEDHLEQLGGTGTVADRLAAEWGGSELRAKLEESLGLTGGPILDPDRRRVFDRFVSLCREDRVFDRALGEAEREGHCRAAASTMMLRHRAFGRLLARAHGRAIRLSVHAGSNAGSKFSIRLFAQHPECVLPYHHCVVLDTKGERPELMTQAMARALPGGVKLIRDARGRAWCFQRERASTEPE